MILSVSFVFLSMIFAFVQGQMLAGDFANDGQFPYQVSLRYNGRHNCGGSILNERWVLTAAHCVTNRDENHTMRDHKLFQVQAGSTVLDMWGTLHDVNQIIVHENYQQLDDIALVEINPPFTFSESTQPIKLHRGELPANEKITVTGWGRVSNDGPRSEMLKFDDLTSISDSECGRRIGTQLRGILCLGHERNHGVCKGDSGGPAAWKGELVGVASFVIVECGTQNPDAYVRLSKYLDWIDSKI